MTLSSRTLGLLCIAFCFAALPVAGWAQETPTATPVGETPTATPIEETPTATPSDTEVPPTDTPTDTEVPPTDTPTEETPTATPTEETPTATPTDTEVPPTDTPVEETPTATPTDTEVPPTDTPVEETPTATPTDTEVPPTDTPTEETPTATPTDTEVPPTDTPTEETPTATPTDTEVPPTDTPTEETPTATPTDTEVPPTNTPTPTQTGVIPTATNTATPAPFEVDAFLGMLGLDRFGTLHIGGSAVFNFDIGFRGANGELIQVLDPNGRLILDGIPDPEAALVWPFTDQDLLADSEFSGQLNVLLGSAGNGSEGLYVLAKAIAGGLPPVQALLGANPAGGGGIDNGRDAVQDFGDFQSSPIDAPQLVDVEGAGNDGFYVLSYTGRIYGEGEINPAIEQLQSLIFSETDVPNPETTVPFDPYAEFIAMDLEIYRGRTRVAVANRTNEYLNGLGAYVLTSQGNVIAVGDAPAVDLSNVPMASEANQVIYRDMEIVPSRDGTNFVGLALMDMFGVAYFAGFQNDDGSFEQAPPGYSQLVPFAPDRSVPPFVFAPGLLWDIARDMEFVLADTPLLGLDEQGNPVASQGLRIGSFVVDGFSVMHTAGRFSKFIPLFTPTGARVDPDGNRYDLMLALPWLIQSGDVLIDAEVARIFR